jgi:hypothetical protein
MSTAAAPDFGAKALSLTATPPASLTPPPAPSPFAVKARPNQQAPANPIVNLGLGAHARQRGQAVDHALASLAGLRTRRS